MPEQLARSATSHVENVVASQLATAIPTLLTKSIAVIEQQLESHKPETRLAAAKLILTAATTLAKLKP